MKQLMTGNEAIARGVYEAGVRFAAAYPGTPSSEIMENIAKYPKDDLHAEWSANEKVALEAAVGFAIAGGRAFAAMKQVGLNVAADPLFSFAYTGTTGGLVLVTADEPGIHSSQTEQDNRYYALMAKVPLLEPSDSQECKDMVIYGIQLSEEMRMPVIIRMTTRVCHSKSLVELGERRTVPAGEYARDIKRFTTMPAIAVQQRYLLEDKLKKLAEISENSPFNFIEWHDKKIGIVTSGIAWQYSKDVFGETASYLKIGFEWPVPMEKIKKFAAEVAELYVIEEVEPFLENPIRQAGLKVKGKDVLPNIGELSVNIIRKAFLGKDAELIPSDPSKLVPRPPVLCAGCPHRGIFYLLSRHKDLFVCGDIGCYGLGALPPLNAVDTVLCMGHSVSGGHGAAKFMEMYEKPLRTVSVVGDSTFFHSGLTGLLNSVYNQSRNVIIILDNRVTGMTGHQDHPGTGRTAQGDPAPEADIPAIVRAMGVKEVAVVNPWNLEETKKALDHALSLDEPAVVICRWPCILKKFNDEDRKEFAMPKIRYAVNQEVCVGCGKCVSTGCPAIRLDRKAKKSSIEAEMCAGCAICAQVCPVQAIAAKA